MLASDQSQQQARRQADHGDTPFHDCQSVRVIVCVRFVRFSRCSRPTPAIAPHVHRPRESFSIVCCRHHTHYRQIEHIGIVRAVVPHDSSESGGNGFSLSIDASPILSDCHIGDSISINGVCLTVTEFDQSSFKVGLSPETLHRSSLGKRIHSLCLVYAFISCYLNTSRTKRRRWSKSRTCNGHKFTFWWSFCPRSRRRHRGHHSACG